MSDLDFLHQLVKAVFPHHTFSSSESKGVRYESLILISNEYPNIEISRSKNRLRIFVDIDEINSSIYEGADWKNHAESLITTFKQKVKNYIQTLEKIS
jgi:hypothetical protein